MPLIQNSAARKDVFTMETEVKLTKLASCAGCGAKVGAGTLARLLDGFRTHTDPRLIVGYDKAYEAGAIITGGHTIQGAEPLYGLAVSGFVHPKKVLTNSGAQPGDVLLLTKPLGVGIITTAAKAGLAEKALTERIYRQMAALNRAARDVMVKYPVHSCTDVTGFALLGHSFEMAQGSGVTVHIQTENVPFHKEAWAFADMGLVPSGAYRNRDYAEAGVRLTREIARPMQDILYDPQTSGGLLIALPEKDAAQCLDELRQSVPQAAAVGYVTEKMDAAIYLE